MSSNICCSYYTHIYAYIERVRLLELLAIAITEEKGMKGIKIGSKYVKLLTYRWHHSIL